MNTPLIVILVVVAIVFLLYRQTRERPVSRSTVTVPVVLGAVGIYQTVDYLQNHHHTVGDIVAVLVGFVVAAAIAVPRAHQVKIYRDAAGVVVSRGGPATIALWVVAIVAHAAISLGVPMAFGEPMARGLSGLDGASILVYLAITIGVQGAIISARAAGVRRSDAADAVVASQRIG
ncbi:hypothetical protein [Gordonia soli]|nr:hypothetical protein [Gordonia soli]